MEELDGGAMRPEKLLTGMSYHLLNKGWALGVAFLLAFLTNPALSCPNWLDTSDSHKVGHGCLEIM